MSTKETIVEKLFSNKELSHDEVILISRSLPTEEGEIIVDAMGKYNHKSDDPYEGCGFVDGREGMKEMVDFFHDLKEALKGHEYSVLSQRCEIYENIINKRPMRLRLLLLNYVTMEQKLTSIQGRGL